ncbi:MAG: hypothetical protein U0800_18120 [Isosphaeraceae bacterium]
MARKQESVWKKRLVLAATVLLTSGGAGGGSWLLKDYPVLQKLLASFQEGNAEGKAAAIREGLATLVDAADGDQKPGVYEVKVSEVELDEAPFSDGQKVDIQVKVVRYDDRDKGAVLWDSSHFGQRLAVVGKDPLSASWPDRPFEVDWQPGDRIAVEVWDRKGFIARQWFEMEPPDADDRFPLRSGSYRLEQVAGRKKPGASSASKIVFESKRIGGESETSTTGRIAGREKDRSRTTR